MPQLSTRHLRGREELHLAHLVLSFITMGYLWQEGEEGTVKVTATREQVHPLLGMWGLMLLPRDSSRGGQVPFPRPQQERDPSCLARAPFTA